MTPTEARNAALQFAMRRIAQDAVSRDRAQKAQSNHPAVKAFDAMCAAQFPGEYPAPAKKGGAA